MASLKGHICGQLIYKHSCSPCVKPFTAEIFQYDEGNAQSRKNIKACMYICMCECSIYCTCNIMNDRRIEPSRMDGAKFLKLISESHFALCPSDILHKGK